jgi:hypothetical protein
VDAGRCHSIQVAAPGADDAHVDERRAVAERVADEKRRRDVIGALQLEHETHCGEVELLQAEGIDAADTSDRAKGCTDPTLVPVLQREPGGGDVREADEVPGKTVAAFLWLLELDGPRCQ